MPFNGFAGSHVDAARPSWKRPGLRRQPSAHRAVGLRNRARLHRLRPPVV